MKKHQFGFYLSLCSLVLSACQLAAPTKVDLPRSRPIASSQPIQETQQALKDKIKNKPVYNGPIRIGLLPQIVSPELGFSSKDLTPVLEKEGFQVQALPDGPLVFQESFFQSGETQRTIQITQTDDPKGWGANDDNQQVYIPGSYQQPDYFPYQVLIPIYNNYLSGYPWWLDN